MVDVILAVDDLVDWHGSNLKQNPQHYSGLGWLGAGPLTAVQCSLGAHVYFHPNVLLSTAGPEIPLKYGVVSCADLLRDLQTWEWLYLSGRLHKPVKIIKKDEEVWSSHLNFIFSAASSS
jgi:mitochondrial translocator assembly and maintenance protein 41